MKPNEKHCIGCEIGERCICGKRYCYGECAFTALPELSKCCEKCFLSIEMMEKLGHCPCCKFFEPVKEEKKCACDNGANVVKAHIPNCKYFTPQDSRDWEKEFERECMDTSALAGLSGGRKLYVKDLIRKLLASQKAELENFYENCPQCTGLLEQFKAEIVEKLKGMKKYPTEDQEDGLEYDEGYDNALDDIIKSLTEKGDER